MATITRFEDLEIWQLARLQTNDFDILIETTLLAKDFELRNQMNASSGSVMDCIAEGFDRSGNTEFRSQLHRCLDRKYIIKERFDELYAKNVTLGSKIMSFITYLQNSAYKGQRYKTKDSSQ